MSNYSWGPTLFRGRVISGVMLLGWKSPGLCVSCSKAIPATEYYMRHKSGALLHMDCHFISLPKKHNRPKRAMVKRSKPVKAGFFR